MNVLFFLEFSRKARTTGSVFPSSRFLVNKMLAPISFADVKTIVELGPGTGVMTREILKRQKKDTKLFAFEINERFFEGLVRIEDPRFIPIFDSAESMKKHLSTFGLSSVDCIISSLPLASIWTRSLIRF